VTTDSPASRAGILVGDLLLALDDHAIDSPEELLDMLHGDRVGRSASVRVLRGGTVRDVDVTIGERPSR
jgi:S1-C subfamily serine protease